jgi:hypothetical protein
MQKGKGSEKMSKGTKPTVQPNKQLTILVTVYSCSGATIQAALEHNDDVWTTETRIAERDARNHDSVILDRVEVTNPVSGDRYACIIGISKSELTSIRNWAQLELMRTIVSRAKE